MASLVKSTQRDSELYPSAWGPTSIFLLYRLFSSRKFSNTHAGALEQEKKAVTHTHTLCSSNTPCASGIYSTPTKRDILHNWMSVCPLFRPTVAVLLLLQPLQPVHF